MVHEVIKDIQFDYYKWPDDDITRDMSGIAFASDVVIKHLKVFFKSLNKVDKDYYVYDLDENKVKVHDPNAETKALEHTERVFAYELYHKWSCWLKGTKWKVNAELRKNVEWFYSKDDETLLFDNTSKSTNESSNDFPDMVLHKSQKEDAQLIVCEIKRDDRIMSDIKKDLNRLYLFTIKKDEENKTADDYYQAFKSGIFLAINTEFNKIISAIRTRMQDFVFKGDEKKLDHIICVSSLYNGNDKKPLICYQSLGEIIRQIKKGEVELKCEQTII